MSKPTPIPTVPPGPLGAAIVAEIERMAAEHPRDEQGRANYPVDVLHILAVTRELLNPALAEAVERGPDGEHLGVSFRELARLTGFAESAIQPRVEQAHGRTPRWIERRDRKRAEAAAAQPPARMGRPPKSTTQADPNAADDAPAAAGGTPKRE